MTNRQRLTESIVVCLGLGLLALILLWPVVQHPTWWLWSPHSQYSDLAVTHWPNAHFTRRALWQEGRFPLWRDTIMGGTPFAANPLSGLGYLPNWLLLFLPWMPLDLGFNLSAFFHIWFAGIAMALLMHRGFGTGVWGTVVAAIIFEASPKLMAHLGAGHVGWVQAWAWMPVVILCWLSGRGAKSSQFFGWAIGGGLALGLQACADMRMAAYTLMAVVAVAGVWSLDMPCGAPMLRQLVRYGVFTLGALCVAVGVSACQWVPMVVLLPDTTRAFMTLSDVTAHSLPLPYLFGLFLADHGGFHEWMVYAGVSTLLLAGIGVRSAWHRRWVRWLCVFLVGVIWFSLGANGGLYVLLWRAVPGLSLLRVPPRAWVLVVFWTAVLAGFGAERTLPLKPWERRVLFVVTVFPALLLIGYSVLVGTPPLNVMMLGIVAPFTTAVMYIKLHMKLPSQLSSFTAPIILSIVVVDLLVVCQSLIEARPPEKVFADGRSAAVWLAAQPGNFRVYSPSYSIPQHVAEFYGVRLADGVDPLQLRVYADFLTRAAGLTPQGYSVTLPPFPGEDVRSALADVVPDTERLRLLGIEYIASAFPLKGIGWQLVDEFDGVYVYMLGSSGEPTTETASRIVLRDGTVLYDYDGRWVDWGWGITGATLVFILTFFIARRNAIDIGAV